MANQEKRYCRGCKCTTDASQFTENENGKQYKQCSRCRGRIHDRRRNDATIVCDCGREVLRTSLRDHLRTLYHEQRMAEKLLQDVARKPMPLAANQQPKQKLVSASVPISQLKSALAPAQMKEKEPTKPMPKAPSLVFRKAMVAPALRPELKPAQAAPGPKSASTDSTRMRHAPFPIPHREDAMTR
jgi:hypothetical protein